MGYYMETGTLHNKADRLIEAFGGKEIDKPPFRYDQIPEGKALIVVVNNGAFEAAAFAFNEREFSVFIRQPDPRPKRYLLIDRHLAEEHSGYPDLETARKNAMKRRHGAAAETGWLKENVRD